MPGPKTRKLIKTNIYNGYESNDKSFLIIISYLSVSERMYRENRSHSCKYETCKCQKESDALNMEFKITMCILSTVRPFQTFYI